MNHPLPGPLKCHTQTAFSLVELVISMAIIAILASVSIISFSHMLNSSQLDNAAKRLVADLKLTKHQAIRDQATYTFEINPTNQSYQAPGVKDLAGTDSIYLDMDPTTSITLSLIDPGNNTIQFNPQGRVNNYGNIILTNGDQKKTITITPGGQIDATP